MTITDIVSEHMSSSLTLGFEEYPLSGLFPHDNRAGSKVTAAMVNRVDHLEDRPSEGVGGGRRDGEREM